MRDVKIYVLELQWSHVLMDVDSRGSSGNATPAVAGLQWSHVLMDVDSRRNICAGIQ